MSEGCGAPVQAVATSPEAGDQVVIAGKVTGSNSPVGGAYVRLLNSDGDFAGEVRTSSEGDFRFYAAPGKWTVRALHRTGNGEVPVTAEGIGLHEVAVALG